jgi:S-formylglutathione hydrolase FrmB
MRKRPTWPGGQVVLVEHTSSLLADNPLGDPATRTFPVWLPPNYRINGKKRYPVLFDLTGYTGSGPSHVAWKAFDENVPEQLARLTKDKKIGPVIIVFPDCFTSLGGNQYINSTAIGAYADYLTRELIPFIDKSFNTNPERDHRGCFGKSSGGYGAIVHGMKYARYWGAVADHSGDAFFDFCYRTEWPTALDVLAKYRKPVQKPGPYRLPNHASRLSPGRDDGRAHRFLEHIWKKARPSGNEVMTLMLLCMAATYDPDPDVPNGFHLPFDLETGELITTRWRRWLKHDPVYMVQRYVKNLQSLKGIFIDCGWHDQYHLHYGARQLSRELSRHGITHTYEEFPDTHSGIDYRMDVSLPFLYRHLH